MKLNVKILSKLFKKVNIESIIISLKNQPLNYVFKGFKEEQVYLLARMGKKSEALTLLLDSSDNIDGAVQFCLDQNDHELWKELIDLSVSNPQHIKGLLKIVGQYVDPLLIIKRIPEGMEIPGLRDALQVVLRDSTDRQVIFYADSYVFLLTNIGYVEKH